MTNLIMEEVKKVEEESLIFRENTIGTKSVEAFLRLVGMKYLHTTFGEFRRRKKNKKVLLKQNSRILL